MPISDCPLAILPGLLCDSRMFQAQLEHFPGAVVIGGFYPDCQTIEEMAVQTLDRLPSRFSLLGHSMGARVALEIVRREPRRVIRLALADTRINQPDDAERARRYALRDVGRQNGFEALIGQWLPSMVADGNIDICGELFEMCRSAGQLVFERQIEALLQRPNVDEVLECIDCPTLVIVGAEDRWSPPADHHGIAARIPDAQMRVVEGAGHMLPFEAPEGFNAELAAWIGRPTSASVDRDDHAK